jgi:two-component system NtrC family sensor kinase
METIPSKKNQHNNAVDSARVDELEELVTRRTYQLEQANCRLEEDIKRRETVEAELTRRNKELTELNDKLSMAQEQLVQSEKLASIGQLAAGVAHEINNPIGYIFSNFASLENYIADLIKMLTAYEEAEQGIQQPLVLSALNDLREQI